MLGSASEVLELLKDAMEEEMNSVSNCLRNTFLNKIPTEEDVRQFCRGQIAHYKVPRYVKFVEEFPMTVTGKVQKFVMRDQMVATMG